MRTSLGEIVSWRGVPRVNANNQTKRNEYRKETFVYIPDKDIYIYPAVKELLFFENTSKKGMKYRKYKFFECVECSENIYVLL